MPNSPKGEWFWLVVERLVKAEDSLRTKIGEEFNLKGLRRFSLWRVARREYKAKPFVVRRVARKNAA